VGFLYADLMAERAVGDLSAGRLAAAVVPVIDRLESEVRSDLGERVAACSKSRFAQEPGLWAPARVEGDPVRRATQAPPPAWCPA